MYCGKCGHVITYGAPAAAPPCTGRLDCRWADCDNVSSSCADVEDAVLHALRLWLAEYEVDTDHQNSVERDLDDRAAQAQDEIRSIHAAQRKLRAQLDRAAERPGVRLGCGEAWQACGDGARSGGVGESGGAGRVFVEANGGWGG